MTFRHRLAVLLMTLSLLPATAVGASADEGRSYRDIVDMTFPVPIDAVWEPSANTWETKSTHFHYDAKRSSTRYHQSIDLMVPYGTPVYAAMGGTISWMPFDRGYYMIRINGDDGRIYDYVHLGHDNDPPSKAYAAGLERGSRVQRGQHLGWAGCSGSASCTSSGYHLHFSVEDPRIVDDPYWPNAHYDNPRLDPYPSLRAARERGDIGGQSVRAAGPFVDVAAKDTHAPNITSIFDAEITVGCGNGRYCPDRAVTRAEMATFLMRALSLSPTDAPFADVPAGSTHAGAIGAIAEAGITQGCGNTGNYCPDRKVTRAEMASFLRRAKGLPVGDAPAFGDTPAGGTHTLDIASIAEAGITKGCGPDTFCPERYVTRAEMASFLARAFLGSDV